MKTSKERFHIQGSVAFLLINITLFINEKISNEPFPPPYCVFFVCITLFAYAVMCATQAAEHDENGEKNPLSIIITEIPGMFAMSLYLPFVIVIMAYNKITGNGK